MHSVPGSARTPVLPKTSSSSGTAAASQSNPDEQPQDVELNNSDVGDSPLGSFAQHQELEPDEGRNLWRSFDPTTSQSSTPTNPGETGKSLMDYISKRELSAKKSSQPTPKQNVSAEKELADLPISTPSKTDSDTTTSSAATSSAPSIYVGTDWTNTDLDQMLEKCPTIVSSTSENILDNVARCADKASALVYLDQELARFDTYLNQLAGRTDIPEDKKTKYQIMARALRSMVSAIRSGEDAAPERSAPLPGATPPAALKCLVESGSVTAPATVTTLSQIVTEALPVFDKHGIPFLEQQCKGDGNCGVTAVYQILHKKNPDSLNELDQLRDQLESSRVKIQKYFVESSTDKRKLLRDIFDDDFQKFKKQLQFYAELEQNIAVDDTQAKRAHDYLASLSACNSWDDIPDGQVGAALEKFSMMDVDDLHPRDRTQTLWLTSAEITELMRLNGYGLQDTGEMEKGTMSPAANRHVMKFVSFDDASDVVYIANNNVGYDPKTFLGSPVNASAQHWTVVVPCTPTKEQQFDAKLKIYRERLALVKDKEPENLVMARTHLTEMFEDDFEQIKMRTIATIESRLKADMSVENSSVENSSAKNPSDETLKKILNVLKSSESISFESTSEQLNRIFGPQTIDILDLWTRLALEEE